MPYDTPHGVACAILLPVGLEYNKTVAGERYRAVGKAMEIGRASCRERV